jgi:hypothetical protein
VSAADMPATRLDFGRLASDAGKVVAGAWPALVAGWFGIVVVTIAVTAIPWWRGQSGDPAQMQVWAQVSAVKALLQAVGASCLATLVATLSLGVLDRDGASGSVRSPGHGFPTALVLNVLVNWSTFAAPFVFAAAASDQKVLGYEAPLRVGALATLAVAAAFWPVAVPAAVAESRWPFSAMGRSARITRGLRWPLIAIFVAYIVLQGGAALVVSYGFEALRLARLTQAFDFGRAASVAVSMVILAPTQILFAAAYLQARRIADGPSPGELHDLFA